LGEFAEDTGLDSRLGFHPGQCGGLGGGIYGCNTRDLGGPLYVPSGEPCGSGSFTEDITIFLYAPRANSLGVFVRILRTVSILTTHVNPWCVYTNLRSTGDLL
jgi:hypothetical protein